MMRRVRHALVNFLGRAVALPTVWALRWSARPLGLALGYHRIGDPEGDSRRELVPKLGSERFASHLAHLRRHYRPVLASELRAAALARRRGARIPVAITFDDDLTSHASVAMPLLERAEMPATFFVCGASLEAPFAFWWERLQRAADEGLLTTADREHLGAAGAASIHEVASAIQQAPPDERDRVADRLGKLVGPDPGDAGMRAADVDALVEAGFEVGFHTRRHYDLRGLDEAQLDAALDEGRAAVEGVTGEPIAAIAYPHGSADAKVAAAANAKGYTSGFTMSPQPVTADGDPLLMGRYEPRYESTSRFALELARVLLRRHSA
jgi:peptidoglycan/xylan/chitin deacetylase (PgdA/CDA1 family)